MAIKPIIFNTEMVRAILDGRKNCTRRVIKFPVNRYTNNVPLADKVVVQELRCDKVNFLEEPFFSYGINLPYQTGDILYVRETWEHFECCCCEGDEHGNCYREPQQSVLNKSCGCYMYRATDEIYGDAKWHPSIHMPKEAARIWLKVTDVRVDRLQEITEEEAGAEGAVDNRGFVHSYDNEYTHIHTVREDFAEIWNNTVKKSDIDRYGWNANPWIWVIKFEVCDKPESEEQKTVGKDWSGKDK